MEVMNPGKRAAETIEEKVTEEVEGFLMDRNPEPTVWIFYKLHNLVVSLCISATEIGPQNFAIKGALVNFDHLSTILCSLAGS